MRSFWNSCWRGQQLISLSHIKQKTVPALRSIQIRQPTTQPCGRRAVTLEDIARNEIRTAQMLSDAIWLRSLGIYEAH